MSKIEEAEPGIQQGKVSRRGKGRAWILLLLLFFCGYVVWQYFHKKAVGVIRVGNQALTDFSQKNDEKELYRGEIIEFFHTATYKERSHSFGENDPVRESVFLSTTDVEGRKIAVTVAYRGTTDLASDPGFQMRQGTPLEYRSKHFQKGLYQGVLFEKVEIPFEITAFFVAEKYIVSFSVTSPFGSDGLEGELLGMIEGFSVAVR
ncbi:MAG: hypothetical protein KBD27_01820 [Candidatus Moranbacteria bacterium]|nr:hypothetical protein [Candidatus Moranbacteria bacterium]